MQPRHSNQTLTNGLRIVTVELPHLHTATVQLYTKVGPRFESAEDSGLSHFLEHMLFRGTDRYPSSYELNFAVERLGGTLDAETGRDYSMIQVSLSPELLDDALALFGEVVGRPLFTQIDVEREIILEEINEDFDEEGVEVCPEEIGRRLMFGDHPLGFRITGPRENVERFDEQDLRRHHERFYCGHNMLLCVAGPVSADRVVESAARSLGEITPGRAAAAAAPAFDQREACFEYAEEPGSQTSVTLLFRALPELDPGYVASLALLRVLDDGMSTRLHYHLCDQLGLAYSVSASIEPLHDVALFEVEGTCTHAKVAELTREIFSLLDDLRGGLCKPEELEKVKRRYHYDIAASRDDAHSMAHWFGGTALYRVPPPLRERIAQMDAVRAEDIRRAAARFLRPDRLVAVVVGGLGPERRRELRQIVREWR